MSKNVRIDGAIQTFFYHVTYTTNGAYKLWPQIVCASYEYELLMHCYRYFLPNHICLVELFA